MQDVDKSYLCLMIFAALFIQFETIMTIRLLTFGIAREISGNQKSILEVPEKCAVGRLRLILASHFPGLDGKMKYAVAVNEEYVEDDFVLCPGDEVAIIPPVSGG